MINRFTQSLKINKTLSRVLKVNKNVVQAQYLPTLTLTSSNIFTKLGQNFSQENNPLAQDPKLLIKILEKNKDDYD